MVHYISGESKAQLLVEMTSDKASSLYYKSEVKKTPN